MKETPFACDMSVLQPSQRIEHIENMRELFSSVQKIAEFENGFSFLLTNDSITLSRLLSFVEKERLCCPFFGFIIELEPEGMAVRFKVTGREGVKEFIKAEFGDFTNKF
jgi:hypothetical protein